MPETDFLSELKRPNVFRVAAMYAVAAWLLARVADATLERLDIPGEAHRLLIPAAAAGFPIAIVPRTAPWGRVVGVPNIGDAENAA